MAKSSVNPSKTKRDMEALSQRIKDSRFSFKDLIIPLSILLILIILGIFLFVPMVRKAMTFRTEFNALKKQEEKLQKIENKLKAIDEADLQMDLVDSKIVIPQNLRVASFMSYIDNLAKEKNLSSSSLSAGDSQTSVIRQNQSEEDRRIYYGVSSPLTYEGELSNVFSFLDNLYDSSPYVISIRGVSLEKVSDLWKVSLSVMGYYVPETTLEVDPYASFDSYTEHQKVVDILKEKAKRLK